jgi:hypothetical protein
MERESMKATVATLWISGVCVVGIAADVDSLSGWAALAGLAALVPLVMLWRWNSPRQRMHGSIREATPLTSQRRSSSPQLCNL